MSPIDTARDALIELYGAVGLLNGVMRDHQLDWRRSGPLPDNPISADAPRPQSGVFVPEGKKVKDFSTLHAGRWKFKGHRKGWNKELAEAIGDIPGDAEHFTYAAGRLWAELVRLWDAHAAALEAIEPLNIRLDGTTDARLKLRRFADDAVRQVNYSPNWRRKIDAVLPMLANLRANPEWQLPDCLVDAFELCEQLRVFGAYAKEGVKGSPENLGSGKKPQEEKLTVNERMHIEIMRDMEQVKGWTAQQWAEHLACAASTVVETPTWKELAILRGEMRAGLAMDRSRGRNPKRKTR